MKPACLSGDALLAVAAARAGCLSACATSPYQRAGNAGEVAAALARSQRTGVACAQPRVPGAGRRGRTAHRRVRSRGFAPALDTARRGDDAHRGRRRRHRARRQPPATGRGGLIVARDIGNGAVPVAAAARRGRAAGRLRHRRERGLPRRAEGGRGQARQHGSVVALDPRTGRCAGGTSCRRAVWRDRRCAAACVAVPVDSQYVILLDATTGGELAQVLSTAEAATFVRALPEGMFFGSRGVFLLSPATARGSRQSSGYLLAQLPPFVRPFYWYDLYRPEQAQYSAIDRNHILWRVAVEGERARFRDDTGRRARLSLPVRVRCDVGRAALGLQPSGRTRSRRRTRAACIAFVSADGDIGALDRVTGRAPLSGAAAGRGRARRDVRRRGVLADAGGGRGRRGAGARLVATLGAIVADPDRRFPDLKLFAIEEIARQPGREATSKLLDILGERGLTPLADAEDQRGAGRPQGHAVGATCSRRRCACTPTTPRDAPRRRSISWRAPWRRSGRAADRGARAGRPASPARDADAGGGADRARAGGDGRRGSGLPALRDFLTMYRADPANDADPSRADRGRRGADQARRRRGSPVVAVRRRGTAHGGAAARAPREGAGRDGSRSRQDGHAGSDGSDGLTD